MQSGASGIIKLVSISMQSRAQKLQEDVRELKNIKIARSSSKTKSTRSFDFRPIRATRFLILPYNGTD